MRENCMIRTTLEFDSTPTEEQIEMLKAAASKPIVFDEDSPEITEDDFKMAYKASEKKRFSVFLNADTYKSAKAYALKYHLSLDDVLEKALAQLLE